MNNTKAKSIVIVNCLIVILFVSCGGNTELQSTFEKTDTNNEGLVGSSYPVFPEDSETELPSQREISEVSSILGSQFIEQSSNSANYTLSSHPDSYVLVPSDGQSIAWTHYCFTGITESKPISAIISTAEAAKFEGGIALPHVMWIGVADYTTYSWEWHGPLGGSATITLNAEAEGENPVRQDRYVSAAGGVHIVVLIDASQVKETEGNPDGLSALRVDSVSINTEEEYVQNLPHWAGFDFVGIGSGSKGAVTVSNKETLALRPEQFAYLEWTHVPAFNANDEINAADAYVITRQGPLDGEPLKVFESIESQFVDPLDAFAGAEPAKGGTQYIYTLTAINEAGSTRPSTAKLLIPMVAPRNLTATKNSTDQDGVALTWQASDGAVEYEVYRGQSAQSSQTSFISNVLNENTEYVDNHAPIGQTCWYFVRAVGVGDGDDTNGQEVGQVSDFSLGAEGLRAVQLTITCETTGVVGDGSGSDPFVLSHGSTYQFRAVDQDGVDYTNVVLWTVTPTAAASFTPNPVGQLEGISTTAGVFSITATYNYLSYSWYKDAMCDVP